jgi:uncharacterized integral membrane protein
MEDPEERRQERDNARTIKSVLLLAIAVVALLFVIKNDNSVEVSFVFTTVDIPLVWALLAALALGFVAGWLTKSFRGRD